MPGKPYQSKLKPYEAELYKLIGNGRSYRDIAASLNGKYNLGISHNAIFSFVKAKSRQQKIPGRMFYEGLDADIRNSLMKQIIAVWTHDSTAIEGNTLTLGETVQVLELGLTINGKSLKDHQEVYGHARAIDLMQKMLTGKEIIEEHLFELHRTIMPMVPVDVQNPVGEWKKDYNGTTGMSGDKIKYIEYAAPQDVPFLMKRWMDGFNRLPHCCPDQSAAVDAYAWAHMVFVRIHPFFDGNGRMARLLANIPVLRSGFPPIVLSPESRGRYIEILWKNQLSLGRLERKDDLLPSHSSVREFKDLLIHEWKNTTELVEEAVIKQEQRNSLK
jgi:Fic family protein